MFSLERVQTEYDLHSTELTRYLTELEDIIETRRLASGQLEVTGESLEVFERISRYRQEGFDSGETIELIVQKMKEGNDEEEKDRVEELQIKSRLLQKQLQYLSQQRAEEKQEEALSLMDKLQQKVPLNLPSHGALSIIIKFFRA